MQKNDCLVAFGSNIGDGKAILQQATELLGSSQYISNLVVSQPLVTMPIGGPAKQDDYVNACLRFQSNASAAVVFNELVRVEKQLGRQRRQRWGSRNIDLDLLLFGSERFFDAAINLEVPHPRMTFRRFVLEPAVTIAAELVHPVTKMPLGELLSHILDCENRLRLVADDTPHWLIANMETLCADLRWEFVWARGDALLQDGVAAKLNVYLHGEAKFVEPKLAGIGPILELNLVDKESVTTEISAAIDTLTSC